MGRVKKNNKYTLKREIELNLKQKLSAGAGRQKKDDDYRIFSYKTHKNYNNCCIRFAQFCIEIDKNCRHIQDTKKYVEQFLKQKEDVENCSPSTVRTYANALAKLYSTEDNVVKSTDFDYTYKKRRSVDFTKNRLSETTQSKHFSLERNADLVNFMKKTGLRRNELEHLKYSDLYEKDNKLYLKIRKYSKHGKPRESEVFAYNDKDKAFIREFLKKRAGENGFFGKVSSAARVHRYRADYAFSLYKHYERDLNTLTFEEKYIRRKEHKGEVYDKEALLIVSASLGHGDDRNDLVINNYFYTAT